ncbi:MAG TPA: NYN domain-containing protein [Candidatus Thermoplasmatota archaeon]|nr:NYN domain-containing protein [Candidatus Thermoplasmatota archaeon]
MVFRDLTTAEAELSFYEQLDGKKVAFIGSKCVILDRDARDRVRPGELWRVRLADKGTFFIGFPEAKLAEAAKRAGATVATLLPQFERALPSATPPARDSHAASSPVAVSVQPTPATASPVAKAKPTRVNEGPTTLAGMTLEPDNVIHAMDRVAFFVDGANIDNACTHAGFFLDWRKTLGYFVGKGLFGGAYYFSTDYMDDEDAQIRFHDGLAAAGFTVRSKPVKLIKDKVTGQERVKGNVDIELALEMIARENTFDVAVLFSGDSDFKRVLEILQSRGKRIFVVSSRNSVSRELIHAADKPVFFMEDFRAIIER